MEECRILLVDDDADDQAIIVEALKTVNAEALVDCVENGEAALTYLGGLNPERTPDLIILDLNMPKMSGSQTLAILKGDQRFQRITVVVYSTSINPLEREKCLLLGAHSYITKPISYKESLATAQRFFDLCE